MIVVYVGIRGTLEVVFNSLLGRELLLYSLISTVRRSLLSREQVVQLIQSVAQTWLWPVIDCWTLN